jgi:hypothetical protein
MLKNMRLDQRLVVVIAVLLGVVTGIGVWSFHLGFDFTTINQYGETIRMFGYGIYARDSYFKAPIFIGSDFTMLVVVLPMLMLAWWKDVQQSTNRTKLGLLALLGVVLYYAASIAFGVTYNYLCVVYIALFSMSLFTLLMIGAQLDYQVVGAAAYPIKGYRWFMVVTGVALFGIWLMDIIPTWFSGQSLVLIEVYTTEITYVLDMGIVSPMIFIALALQKRKHGLGDVLGFGILVLCVVMGVMLPIQTIFQLMAGIYIPIPVLIIKVGIFMVLALFAMYFSVRVWKQQG